VGPGPTEKRGGYFKGSSTSNNFAANLHSAAIPYFPLVSSRPRASFEIFVCYCNEQNVNLFAAIIHFVQNFRNLFPELMDLRSTTINMRIPRKLCKLRRCTSNRIVCGKNCPTLLQFAYLRARRAYTFCSPLQESRTAQEGLLLCPVRGSIHN